MAFSSGSKAIIGFTGFTALGGVVYGTYTQLFKATSIREELIKKGKTPLDLNAKNGEDFELLKELAKQHHSNNPKGKTKIEGLNLTTAEDTEALKKECQKLFDTNSKDEKFQSKLANAEAWCTKDNAPRKVSSLISQGKKLLTNSDTAEWDAPWKLFQEDFKNKVPNTPWKIEGWTEVNGNPDFKDGFKKRCIANGGDSIMLSEKDYLAQIEKYCTKNV